MIEREIERGRCKYTYKMKKKNNLTKSKLKSCKIERSSKVKKKKREETREKGEEKRSEE